MPVLIFTEGTTADHYQASSVTIDDGRPILGIELARLSQHTLFIKGTDAVVTAVLDGKRQPQTLYPRDGVTMLPAGLEWSCSPMYPYAGTLIRLDNRLFSEVTLGEVEHCEIDFRVADVTDRSTSLIAGALRDMAKTDTLQAYPILAESLAMALTTETIKKLSPRASDRMGRKKNGLTKARKQRVIDFADANIDRLITLSDLANVANLSKYHFCRSFKLSTGMTPARFMLTKRIDRAKRLLKDGVSIAEVSLLCAFSSQAHFTSAFKQVVGMTPGQFKHGIMSVGIALLHLTEPIIEFVT